MKALFDTNVVLDHLLDRKPHADAAEAVLSLVDSGAVEGVIGATTVTTIHYLASKAVGTKPAHKHVRTLLSLFDVACVDKDVLLDALDAGFADFEDAVLHATALECGATAIVTRNGADFARSKVPVFEPAEFVAAILASM